MSSEIKRFLIPAEGPEVEPIKKGIALLIELCNKSEKPLNAILLIPTKNNIQGTTLETALEKSLVKSLLKGELLPLPKGGHLKLETMRTFREYIPFDVIIGVYVNEKMLDQIDNARNVKFIIIIPWIMEQVIQWIKTWSPTIIGETPSISEEKIGNPVVEEALKLLTSIVNLSTGLSYPSDRDNAIYLLQLLYENKEEFNPDSIKSWALRNGWKPEGANELREIAQGILDRKKFRIGKIIYWNPNIILELRQKAKKNKNE